MSAATTATTARSPQTPNSTRPFESDGTGGTPESTDRPAYHQVGNGDVAGLHLFACCLPVKGARRSSICDVQRGTFHFIPNALYHIVTAYRGWSREAILAEYDAAYIPTIEQYFDFLAEHELAYWTSEPERFPEMDLSWEAPEAIRNAILDLDDTSTHDLASVFAQLDDLYCKAVEIRYHDPVSLDEVEALLEPTTTGRLRGIQLILPYRDPEEGVWDLDRLVQLRNDHPRLLVVVAYDAPTDDVQNTDDGAVLRRVEQTIRPTDHCGLVQPGSFAVTESSFIENMRHNSCLNRKISVDVNGEIKNCPTMPVSYGNVEETSLHSAIAQQSFRELWDINKDQIEVCKDCEFRYICTDCRAYVTDPDDRYSKPSKCTYDPYTATWTRTPEADPDDIYIPLPVLNDLPTLAA